MRVLGGGTPCGVTIHKIDADIGTVDILLQKQVTFDLETDTLRSSHQKLCGTIENLFHNNLDALLTSRLPTHKQPNGGFFHQVADRQHVAHLLKQLGWDTPIRQLLRHDKKA